MSEEAKGFLVLLGLITILSALLALYVREYGRSETLRREAVMKGCAEYYPTEGGAGWRWKPEVKNEN